MNRQLFENAIKKCEQNTEFIQEQIYECRDQNLKNVSLI